MTKELNQTANIQRRPRDQSRPATLKDISGTTGLTVATISRILAGKNGFAAATVKRVKEAADSLGYRPNRIVSGLRSGSTGMVGAILPVHAEWGANLLAGLSEELGKANFVPIVMDCPSSSMSELEMVYHLLDRRVEGVVLFPSDDQVSNDYFEELRTRHVPLVVTVRRLPRVRSPFVGCDDRESGRLAAEHLIELGHRRLGHLAGPPEMSTGRDRAEGFLEGAEKCESANVSRLNLPNFYPDPILIRSFLKEQPDLTGIFCANEAIALELYRIAGELGLEIPGDLSVVSHGNGKVAPWLTPSLTSTVEDSLELGREAARVLLSEIKGKRKEQVSRTVSTKLVIRNSTAPCFKKCE